MTRKELLVEAEKCVCTDREAQYGTPENNFKIIADLWNLYLADKKVIDSHDVGIMMALLKIARIKSGMTKDDNYIDAIGYLACAGELTPEAYHVRHILERTMVEHDVVGTRPLTEAEKAYVYDDANTTSELINEIIHYAK